MLLLLLFSCVVVLFYCCCFIVVLLLFYYCFGCFVAFCCFLFFCCFLVLLCFLLIFVVLFCCCCFSFCRLETRKYSFTQRTINNFQNSTHSVVLLPGLSDVYLAYDFYLVTTVLAFVVPITVVNKEEGLLFDCWHLWVILSKSTTELKLPAANSRSRMLSTSGLILFLLSSSVLLSWSGS